MKTTLPQSNEWGVMREIVAPLELGTAQYFLTFATCLCGQPATGTIRSIMNENLGVACRRCAEQRIGAARAVRGKTHG